MSTTANRKVIYYSDKLNDDFAGTAINTRTIDSSYQYIKDSPIRNILEFILYRIIATPLAWLLCKTVFGLKIKNRKVVRKLKNSGFFLYGNHTNCLADAFTPTLISFPAKAHIVVNPDAVSIKGLGSIVEMLGAVPVPSTLHGMRSFRDALDHRYRQNRSLAIYPEAHIWPYYTGIRPFHATSFIYPVKLGAPCIAFVATYRQRKILKSLPPLMTITLSHPMYPDPALSESQAKQKLRDEVFEFMNKTAGSRDNYAYIDYIRTPHASDDNQKHSVQSGTQTG